MTFRSNNLAGSREEIMKTGRNRFQRSVVVISIGAFAWLYVLCLIGTQLRAQVSNSYTPGVDVSLYTYETYTDWLHKYAEAKPDFKPGDVLTTKDLERLRPFVPPGYFEQLNFPEFKAAIDTTEDWTPVQAYMDCTEKYSAQVRLNPDHTLANYTCGRPFPDIRAGDPDAGIKATWNFEYRWQNYGTALLNLFWIWSRPGPGHADMVSELQPVLPPEAWDLTYATFGIKTKWPTDQDLQAMYRGGGTFQRILNSSHQRVYFTHLAQLPDHTLPMAGAQDFEYKEFTAFFSPYDIRGTGFIIFRYDDPYRADDAWVYIPTIRRVRRASAEVRSDSLLGTDNTLDDFYGYSGHEVEWNFQFLGWKDILLPVARRDYAYLYGSEGMVPDSAWQMRRAGLVYRTSKNPRYPETCLMFWDAQTFGTSYYFNFDVKRRLWKTNFYWSERIDSVKDFGELVRGLHLPQFVSHNIVNVQNNRGTIETFTGLFFPNLDVKHTQKLYDINQLEQVHR